LLGNTFLTGIKFVAFFISGSGAMLSEAIHSLADSGNQGLLYLGIRKSERPADKMFHYGYGADRFLFALLAAVGIFVLGCGVTVYHGIMCLVHPPDLHLGWVTFTVLAISFLVDGWVLLAAIRAVHASKGSQSLWKFVRSSSDPTVLAVLFEDFIACLGVLVATVGILISYYTGSPVFDAVSSIIIGLLLGVMAMWLGYRNRQLILGPAIPREIEDAVVAYLKQQPSVTTVSDIKTQVVAADRFRLKAEIDYDGRHLSVQHTGWVRDQLPELSDDATIEQFVADFGERMLDTLAKEVDRIEREIAREFPQLRHLDLESD
jgi:zinc transporter 9